MKEVSRWALKDTTRLRNVNRLKAYIESVSSALHKFTQFGLIVPTYLRQVQLSQPDPIEGDRKQKEQYIRGFDTSQIETTERGSVRVLNLCSLWSQ